jgi:murein DD-endopeptidase MepM/ murein hydrolase activator NlpD
MALGRPIRGGQITQGFGPSRTALEPHMWVSATRRAYWQPYPGGKYSAHCHAGVDFAGKPKGAPLLALEDGKVTRSEFDRYNGGGHVVEVEIRPNVRYSFNHCDSRKVRVGQRVKRGQIIATIGDSGTLWTGSAFIPSALGVHCHVNLTIRERLSDGITRTMMYDVSDFMEGGKLADNKRIKPL